MTTRGRRRFFDTCLAVIHLAAIFTATATIQQWYHSGDLRWLSVVVTYCVVAQTLYTMLLRPRIDAALVYRLGAARHSHWSTGIDVAATFVSAWMFTLAVSLAFA
ncbi:MAG: hypothetical protein K2Q20_11740 [Phycisphaerales bacterium]|nr:hypothetical protein [Phycisphaerales bacterium]